MTLVLVAVLVGGNQPEQLGGTRFPSGISADSTSPISGEVRGTTLTVTGAVTATGGVITFATTTIQGPLVSGGDTFATTTNGPGTFTAAQVCDNSIITATPNVGSVTLTFPTSALLFADCIPNPGDQKSLILRNASSTGTAIITIADGANGIHLEQEGATTVVDNSEWAELLFLNVDDTSHVLRVTILQDAD